MTKRILEFLMAGIFMALAWSLRGQFGHLKGGLIPGAVAALTPLLFMRGRWLSSAGIALALSSLGFSLGGHMSYGRLVEYVEFHKLSESMPQIIRIFLIGGVWGGLGSTFLGYGFSEKTFTRHDFIAVSIVWLFWLVTLGIMDLESVDILILYLGFAALHLYNYYFKKSKLVVDYGFGGLLGFGAAFVIAILLLNLGRRGLLLGPWPWWLLRDQIIGFIGGAVLWGIAVHSQNNKTLPSLGNDSVSFHKIGIIFFSVMIPAINSVNVLSHWFRLKTVSHPEFLAVALVAVLFTALFFFFLNKWEIFSIHLERTILSTTLFFIWYMSLIAIAKDFGILGFRSWEAAYTLYLVFSFLVTCFLCFRFFRPGPAAS